MSGLSGPDRTSSEENRSHDTTTTPSSDNIVNLHGQQYYSIENNETGTRRTILVPIRQSTPPPSYNSIFDADQNINRHQGVLKHPIVQD